MIFSINKGEAIMRRRIKVLMSIFILALAASPVSYAQKSDSGAQNITTTINTARYILFGGTYTLNGNGDNRESAVFKLDTYTGKVWILKVDKSGAGRLIQWVAVEDPDNISTDNKADSVKNDESKKVNLKGLKTLDEQ